MNNNELPERINTVNASSKKDDPKIIDVSPDDIQIVDNDRERSFKEYQDNHIKSAREKRSRAILILLTLMGYLVGIGLFASITRNIYELNSIAGYCVGGLLTLFYTILFVLILRDIYSKHSFDLDFSSKPGSKNAEHKNNRVRWERAENIVNQNGAIHNLYTKKKDHNQALDEIEKAVILYGRKFPSYKSSDSQKLAENLSVRRKKNGVIYKKAKAIIWKKAVLCGTLTAITPDTLVDAGIIVVKNRERIKDIIWLYGFRPSDAERNRIRLKVITSACVGLGLSSRPRGASLASKIFKKDSNSTRVQRLGSVIDRGAQFIGNGAMTYIIGRYTIRARISEYRRQDIFRKQIANRNERYLEPCDRKELSSQIKIQVKEYKSEKNKEKAEKSA